MTELERELTRRLRDADGRQETLEAENARLREESDDWQKKAILHWSVREDLEAENARLREEVDAAEAKTREVWAELTRLREAEAICLKYHSARARVMQENARLREALKEADRVLALAQEELKDPAWDLHTFSVVVTMVKKARNALKETT